MFDFSCGTRPAEHASFLLSGLNPAAELADRQQRSGDRDEERRQEGPPKYTDVKMNEIDPMVRFKGKVVVMYFAAYAKDRGFTAKLVWFYEALRAAGEPIEVLFVSSDASEKEFKSSLAEGHKDWLALSWSNVSLRRLFTTAIAFKGLPDIVLLNEGNNPVKGAWCEDVENSQNPADASRVFKEWKRVVGVAIVLDAADLRTARIAALDRSTNRHGQSTDVPCSHTIDSVPASTADADSKEYHGVDASVRAKRLAALDGENGGDDFFSFVRSGVGVFCGCARTPTPREPPLLADSLSVHRQNERNKSENMTTSKVDS